FVWLLPLVFALHIREEWPAFVAWARKHASARYSKSDYIKVHRAGLIAAFLWGAVIYSFPNRWSTSRFFLVTLAPGLFFNTLFHIGASLRTRTYCPGVITALLLYLPVSVLLTGLAYRDHLLSIKSATIVF